MPAILTAHRRAAPWPPTSFGRAPRTARRPWQFLVRSRRVSSRVPTGQTVNRGLHARWLASPSSQRPCSRHSNAIGSSSSSWISHGSRTRIVPPVHPDAFATMLDTTNRATQAWFFCACRTSFRVRSTERPRDVVPLTSTRSSRSPSRQSRSNGMVAETSSTSGHMLA